jgi:hypothetical protein
MVLLAAVLAAQAAAQPPQETPGASPDPNAALGAPVTVHGVVMNAATGEPLPRALVQINGGAGEAVLTDGDGRFEVAGVPLGPSVFVLTKPGFEDAPGAENGFLLRDLRGYSHNVFVTADTAELVFSMRPTNAIRGHIELSTGDAAQNIGLMLFQRQIQNGHSAWRVTSSTRTNADGNFHFAHLDDGDYVIRAGPAPEAEMSGQPAPDRGREAPWNGYTEVYFPDARDFSGAGRIHVAGGEQAEANVTMRLEAFHAVSATVELPPQLRISGAESMIDTEIVGAEGMPAPYGFQFDPGSGKFWGRLPDGTFTIRFTATRSGSLPVSGNGLVSLLNSPMTGQTDVTVAGHPVTKRIAMGPMVSSPLQVMVARTRSAGSGSPGNHGEVFVEITQAGAVSDGGQSAFAQGSGPGMIDTTPPAPGKYWVHTIIADSSLCEGSFTAGGSSLGREPLTVGLGGATAPLTLMLRDDCATLKVSLPGSLAGMTAGEEPAYTVYLVPDFDATVGDESRTLRASTETSFTFTSLTPGSYHVYVFTAPVNLEYRNRDVLAGLHGQGVTLTPGESGNLVLEVPAQ